MPCGAPEPLSVTPSPAVKRVASVPNTAVAGDEHEFVVELGSRLAGETRDPVPLEGHPRPSSSTLVRIIEHSGRVGEVPERRRSLKDGGQSRGSSRASRRDAGGWTREADRYASARS